MKAPGELTKVIMSQMEKGRTVTFTPDVDHRTLTVTIADDLLKHEHWYTFEIIEMAAFDMLSYGIGKSGGLLDEA